MIEKITLPLKVPFDNEQAVIDDLDCVCFLFGPNGSGKTTISQFIAEHAGNIDSANLQWSNGSPVRTYVYNRGFVTRNFENKSAVPGVFTMGEDSIEAQRNVERLETEITREKVKRDNAQANLDQANAELGAARNRIKDECWTIRGELPSSLSSRLTGVRTKDQFRDKFLERIATLKPKDSLPDPDDLERRVAVVFDENASTSPDLPTIDLEKLISFEGKAIFQKTIIGKEDIPIGALIKKLGNSDWVAQGRRFAVEGDVCPFCQQHTVTDKLRSDMEAFFDETYQSDVEELVRTSRDYIANADEIISSVDELLDSHARFIDKEALQAQLAELRRIVQVNMSEIGRKQGEPSIAIDLVSADEVCQKIAQLLDDAAKAVESHNEMIRHRSEQKSSIVAEIWLYAAKISEPRIRVLRENETNAQSKVSGLMNAVARHKEAIQKSIDELRAAEKSLTNVRETAEAINDLLERFGFTNFKMVVAEDDKSYRIVREDGTSVQDTLSEGESSFLTFLYFYHLMNGSQESTGTTDKRVVVIDDPISSMDADVLFVVSTLVRRLAKEARDGSGKTEQLLVLTHNITFHREITYIRAGEGDPKTSYYVIRKDGSHSKVMRCDSNPVSSTYELLWEDFCRDDCQPITAANVARRITETFFKLVGGIDPDDVIATMGSPDREIARSFMAWANAGSHSPFDDETFFNASTTTDMYRRVLGDVFENAGYKTHYDEMVARFASAHESTL